MITKIKILIMNIKIIIISSPHEFHFVHEGLPHARHKRSIPHSRKLKTDPQVRIWLVIWSLYWPVALCMYWSSQHPINRETGYSNVLKCEHTDLKGVLLSPLFDTHGKLSVLCPLRHIHATFASFSMQEHLSITIQMEPQVNSSNAILHPKMIQI